MKADINVTLTGPTVDGKMRGVRFINTGIMQVATTITRNETDGGVTLTSPDDASRIAAKLGVEYPYLDTVNNSFYDNPADPPKTQNPWYKSPTALFRGPSEYDWSQIKAATAQNAPANDPSVTTNLKATDGPFWQTVVPNGGGDVQKVTLEMHFKVYVAAQTIDNNLPTGFTTKTAPVNLYFSEGEAPWIFNGSGTVKRGTWTADVKAAGNYVDAKGNQTENLAAPPAPANGSAVAPILKRPLSPDSPNLNQILNTVVNKGNAKAGERSLLDTKSFWQ